MYMVMMVERCLPNRFPIWRTQDQPESLTRPWKHFLCAPQASGPRTRNPLHTRSRRSGWGPPHQRPPKQRGLAPPPPTPRSCQAPSARAGSHLQVGDQEQDAPHGEHGHGQEEQHGCVCKDPDRGGVTPPGNPNTEPRTLGPPLLPTRAAQLCLQGSRQRRVTPPGNPNTQPRTLGPPLLPTSLHSGPRFWAALPAPSKGLRGPSSLPHVLLQRDLLPIKDDPWSTAGWMSRERQDSTRCPLPSLNHTQSFSS